MDSKSLRARKPSFLIRLWRLALGVFAIAVLYDLLARVLVNHPYSLFSGEHLTVGEHETSGILPYVLIDESFPAFVGTLSIKCEELLGTEKACEVFNAVLICFLVVIFQGMIFEAVCNAEWVKEKVNIKECWTEVKWYNPWSWVESVVCSLVEVTRWILQWTCKVRIIILVTSFIACTVVLVALVVA